MDQILTAPTPENTTTVLLCGGRATRMGGKDKGLIELQGRPLYQYVLERLAPQTHACFINANRHLDEYAGSGLPVFPDARTDYPGPVAGLACAFEHAQTEWLMTAPCDMPLLPTDLFQRLQRAARQLTDHPAFVVHDGERQQHLLCLLHRSLAARLQQFYETGQRAIHRWLDQVDAVKVDCSDLHDAFININTLEELKQMEDKIR